MGTEHHGTDEQHDHAEHTSTEHSRTETHEHHEGHVDGDTHVSHDKIGRASCRERV